MRLFNFSNRTQFRICQKGVYPNFRIEFRKPKESAWRVANGNSTCWWGVPHNRLLNSAGTYITLEEAEAAAAILIEARAFIDAPYHVVKEF